MGEVHLVQEGDEAKRTKRILDIPVGPGSPMYYDPAALTGTP